MMVLSRKGKDGDLTYSLSLSNAYYSRTLHSSRPNPALEHNGVLPELEIDPNEPKYCYCNQVSFGDMVACDGENVIHLSLSRNASYAKFRFFFYSVKKNGFIMPVLV